jgi:segregation and condensation protein A
MLEFKLEIFEGPLDLMLSLIAKHKLNIRDIEIAVLLEQFLDYIEAAAENDMEIAGEFLEAAARLIYIKTASLLPRHEAEKLKRELEGALIELALAKAAADKMRLEYIGDLIYTRCPAAIPAALPSDLLYERLHDPAELAEALRCVADRDRLRELFRRPPTEEQINPAAVIDYVSVYSKIVYVLRRIRTGNRIEVAPLFVGQNRSEKVAVFMALLELTSHGRIAFSDDLLYIEIREREKIS